MLKDTLFCYIFNPPCVFVNSDKVGELELQDLQEVVLQKKLTLGVQGEAMSSSPSVIRWPSQVHVSRDIAGLIHHSPFLLATATSFTHYLFVQDSPSDISDRYNDVQYAKSPSLL